MKYLLLLLGLWFAPQALAFKTCNSYDRTYYLAVAYYQNGGYVSQGWYPVEARQCAELNFPNPSSQFYVYFDDGKLSKSAGQFPFCISRPGPFKIANANRLAVARSCPAENFAVYNLPANSTLYLGQIFDPEDPSQPGEPSEPGYAWIGDLYYEGGLQRQLKAYLEGTFASSEVKFDLSACAEDVSILRVEAMENNQLLTATSLSGNGELFHFNRSIAIQELLVSLNGPTSGERVPCSIPVFIPKSQTERVLTLISEDNQ